MRTFIDHRFAFMTAGRLILSIMLCASLSACGGDDDNDDGGAAIVAPSALSYTSPVQATVGTAITALSPTVTGSVTSYSVSPALPAGLSISASTGAISGTPATAAAQATYTVSASNSGGSTTFGLVLTVSASPPSGLSYAGPVQATAGTAITALTPTVTGSVASYSVDPALPAGLALNTTTGVISGTPTTAAAQATYTVTASNTAGSTDFALVLTVDAAPVVTATGTFRDATVAGLGYSSGGQSGVTDANGQFTYEVDQPISFSVGGVSLGTAPLGKALIMPMDLVPNGSGTSIEVVNIVRFLVMLDQDGNPDNGIVISEAVREAAASWVQVDFATADLATALAPVIATAQVADSGAHALPDAVTAQTHLRSSFMCAHSGGFVGPHTEDGEVGDQGRFVAAVFPNGTIEAQSYIDVPPAQEGSFVWMADAMSALLDGTFAIDENYENPMLISGRYSGTDRISGTWEDAPGASNPASGTFTGTRLGGAASARYRFVGGYVFHPDQVTEEAEGLAVLDVDTAGNVTGFLYETSSGQQFSVTGSVSGTTLTATAAGVAITGTFTDAGSGSFYLDGDFTFDGEPYGLWSDGCRLN